MCDLDLNVKSVCGDLGFEVDSDVLNEEIKISLPLDLGLSEEDFVVVDEITNQNVIVQNDIFGFNFKSVSPVDVEFFNSDVVFMDDSSFGCNIDVDVVLFESSDGNFHFEDDVVLVLE